MISQSRETHKLEIVYCRRLPLSSELLDCFRFDLDSNFQNPPNSRFGDPFSSFLRFFAFNSFCRHLRLLKTMFMALLMGIEPRSLRHHTRGLLQLNSTSYKIIEICRYCLFRSAMRYCLAMTPTFSFSSPSHFSLLALMSHINVNN